jgi:DnaJ-class molecular chaperone
VVTPKTIKKIEGEGMPILDKKDYSEVVKRKGDLYVQFEIKFPSVLTND